MKRYSVLLAIFAFLFTAPAVFGQSFNIKKVEKITRAAVKKAYASSVRIWGYDTVSKQQNSAQFSGVVVSEDGYVLTVAHATVPGNTYKVFFTDGRDGIAVALGRIGFKEKQNMPDVALLKIIGQGKWPFAEMGWSSSLKINELCISISYPETLDQKLPTVRFGRIVKPMTEWGFVQSTCKMEPGDSGGPLYDDMGRVVALHSRIDLSEEVNFEVPVDLYRKYWTALQKPEDYAALPALLDTVKADPLGAEIRTIPGQENLTANFAGYGRKYNGFVAAISSNVHGKLQKANGTVFSLDGTFVLAKSSIVGKDAELVLEDKRVKMNVLARDIENDLVLLQAAERNALTGKLKGISLKSVMKDSLPPVFEDLGGFLISPLGNSGYKVGVLGSRSFMQPRKFSIGFFGAGANFQNEQIILTRMAPDGPAAAGKLELGDQITGINGVPISRPEHYGDELMKYSPGDSISIQGVRKGNPYSLLVGIRVQPLTNGHPAERFEGGKSLRLDGFASVFAQDAALLPEDCGGPVFDASGRFYGINIARFSRTTTLVMPKQVIFRFIERSLNFL